MNKKLLLTAVSITVLSSGLFGISTISAHAADNHSTSIVQKIAEKFRLNKDDVQKFFDEERAAHATQMQAKMDEHLSQLVTEGKLTEAQKQLIIAKQKELTTSKKSNMENLKNLTQDQRKAAREKEKTNLEAWAKQNGIDIKYLFFGHRMKGWR